MKPGDLVEYTGYHNLVLTQRPGRWSVDNPIVTRMKGGQLGLVIATTDIQIGGRSFSFTRAEALVLYECRLGWGVIGTSLRVHA